MKKSRFFIVDRDGYYLTYVRAMGGYFSHRLSNSPESISFDSYLLALTFCNGYNSIAGLDPSCFVSPVVIEL